MPDTRPMLLTGAAGVLGRWLRPHLVATYGALRCSDIVDPAPRQEGETLVIADLADAAAVDRLVAGAGRIIHFGGISYEASFDRILAANIVGTFNVFDAARRHGAGPIVYASSNHAIGFYTRDDRIDGEARARPDSYYGVSKAFGDDLASLYADKYGLDIACLRIGTAAPVPKEPEPCREITTPSACRRDSASRTTGRETPNRSQSCPSEGSLPPSGSAPETILARICS